MKKISTKITIMIMLLCISPLFINGLLILKQEYEKYVIKKDVKNDVENFITTLYSSEQEYINGSYLDSITALTENEKIEILDNKKEKMETFLVYCFWKYSISDNKSSPVISFSDFSNIHVIYKNKNRTITDYPNQEINRFTYPFANENVKMDFYYLNPKNYRIRIINSDCDCIFDSQAYTTLGYHNEDYFDLSMDWDVYYNTKQLRNAYYDGEIKQFNIDINVNGHSEELYTVKKFNFQGIKGLVLFSGPFDSTKTVSQIFESYLYLLRYDFIRILFAIIIVLFLIITIAVPIIKLSKDILTIIDNNGKIIIKKLYGNNRKDEIGDLSKSFSTIIDSLNSRIEETEMMTSDLSHEIKNPLSAIRMLTDTINSENLSESEKNDMCVQLQNEIKRIETIVSNIRQTSKIENKAYEDSKEVIECDKYLNNIVSFYSSKYPIKKIKCTLNAEDKCIFITPELLDTIFDNLISNAFSFADEILITSSINKNQIQFSIEDNGPGIPIEEREKIFKRFYSNRKQQDKIAHDGLGLHLVKYIVNSINGNIKVEKSEKLGGASFIIAVPIYKREKKQK